MRRFKIHWLHACGKFAPEIALLVRQIPPTVRGVMNMYQKGGIQLVIPIALENLAFKIR
jgi:hypothetical protein